nr:MAG TPA: hypothetical protein [Bacteriophage sp.]
MALPGFDSPACFYPEFSGDQQKSKIDAVEDASRERCPAISLYFFTNNLK